MRYVMKQKLFCWGDDFCIKDDQERGLCTVILPRSQSI